MRAKTVIKQSVKLLSLVLAVGLSVCFLQEFVLCNADHNRERIKGFYLEENNSLDVVYMGASEVYSDLAPGYAYKNNGVTSYLYASQASSILSYKYQLTELLKHQNPKLIVIELNSAVYANDEQVVKDENVRNYVDNTPLSFDKVDFVNSYTDKNKEEYLFPLIKYHDTWKDLGDNMGFISTIAKGRARGYNYLKGMMNQTVIFQSTQRVVNDFIADINDKKPLTELSEKKLRELLRFCKDKNLDNVVFARFPHLVTRRTLDRCERSNTVEQIVTEYGFEYLNFEKNCEEIGLDYEKDFYNLDHLNVYGQRKFTDYITGFIGKKYGIKGSKLSDNRQAEWNSAYDYYNAYYSYSDELIKQNTSKELDESIIESPEFTKHLAKS
ncbi:MAG TPA: hypothetical protein DEO32_01420 [Ruminococcaceae bacterium]|nr:hypothetical protein [Oscillospiraceae bacterium]